MPALGMGYDLGVGEPAHLAANRLEGLIKTGVADRAFLRLRDQSGKGGAVFAGGAVGDQPVDDRVAKGRDVLGPEAEVGKAQDFALIHRDAVEHLGEIFAKPDAGQQQLGLAETALLAHALSVCRHFLDRFDIGREPRQPMDGVLFGLHLVGAQLAVVAHPVADGVERAIQKPLGGEMSLMGEVVERHGARLSSGGRRFAAAQHASSPSPLQCVSLAPMGVDSRSRGWRLWRHPVKMAVCDGRLEKGARRPENRLAGGGEVRRR